MLEKEIPMIRTTKGTRWMVLSAAAAAALSLTALLSAPSAVRAADPAPTADQLKFFEDKIRPILAESCVGCHGPDKQKGGLRMDTRAFLIAGAKHDDETHSVVTPGNPEKSMIIEAVEYKNEDMQMPPPKKKVSMKLP